MGRVAERDVGIEERRSEEERRRARRVAFAQAFQAALDAQNLTHREFAGRAGWPNHTKMYPWLRGHAEPEPEQVFELEKVLGLQGGTLSHHLGYEPVDKGSMPPDLEKLVRSYPLLPNWARKVITTIIDEGVSPPSEDDRKN